MNYLAIDIGGSAIKYAVINDIGEILKNNKKEHEYKNIIELKTGIKDIVNEYKKEYDFNILTISSPGSVNSKTKIIYGASALPFIHENNWVNEIADELKLKVYIENDANCACLCESWLGNAKGLQNIVSVVIGTGIGGSIIINGKLINGSNLYGGEFGYQIADFNNPSITISQYLSTTALINRAKRFKNVSDGLEVFEYFDNKDEDILKVVENYYKDLAIFMYNLMHTFDPDIILIGGAISNREEIVTKIKGYYDKFLEESISDLKLKIDKCKFNNKSNLLGAVYNAKKENDEI